MDNLYFIDTETGGLKPYSNGLCSICIKKHDSNFERNLVFYPQKKVYDMGSFAVNGFDMKTLYNQGVSRDELLKTINSMAEIGGKQGYLILCGWNVGFDIDFISNAYKEKSAKFPCPIVAYDLMEVAKKFIKKQDKRKKEDNGVENYKLTTIYQALFNDYKEELAHTATYDVLMTEKLYIKFIELGFIKE